MKTKNTIETTTCQETMAGRLRIACATRILPLLLLLALPAVVQAQFNYGTITTINGTMITVTKYTGTGGAVTIPETINGLPVTRIGYMTFYDCTNLTSVTIPRASAFRTAIPGGDGSDGVGQF